MSRRLIHGWHHDKLGKLAIGNGLWFFIFLASSHFLKEKEKVIKVLLLCPRNVYL
jgi:hypothetical protein